MWARFRHDCKGNEVGVHMNLTKAVEVAQEWALWFDCPTFVVQIGPQVYKVVFRPSQGDQIVSRIDA